MRIAGFSFEPFNLRFKTPFRFFDATLTEKSGFIIRLTDTDGNIGIGAVEPFEYFGTESLTSSLSFLKSKLQEISAREFQITTEFFDFISKDFNNYPAANCGLEQAFISLANFSEPEFFTKKFGNKFKNSVIVNGVIGLGDAEAVIRRAGELIEQGRTTLKIKCGREKIFQDLKIFMALRKEFGDKIILRGDANGKWTKTQAVEILKAMEDFDIQYVEQPVSNLDDFDFLKSRVKTPIAADESFRGLDDLEKIMTRGTVDYLILKPIPAGGLLNSLRIIDKCNEKNLPVVVTTTMDSSISKRIDVAAASYLKSEIACGLDTSQFFENDLTGDIYPVDSGRITIDRIVL